jgi:hypothetical protein
MKVGVVCKLFGGRQQFNKGKATRFGRYKFTRSTTFKGTKTSVGRYFYLPAFAWTIGNSNLFLFLLYFLDFVLESKVAFPMVIFDLALVIFQKFTRKTLIQVLFLRLLTSQSYTKYIMCKSNVYLECIHGHKPIQMQNNSNHAYGDKYIKINLHM